MSRFNNKIKIAIVDDHPMSRMGTQAMLSGNDKIEIAQLIKSGRDALDFLALNSLDLIVVDVMMPEMDGFELLRKIKLDYPKIKVAMLTISEERESILKALAYDADGFILKDVDKEEFQQIIKKIYAGEKYFCSKMLNAIIPDFIHFAKLHYNLDSALVDKNQLQNSQAPKNIADMLTNREIEILKLIGSGKSSKEIAVAFNISTYTVSTHRKNIYAKLGIEELSNLIKIAKSIK